jgi:hypothetical protein
MAILFESNGDWPDSDEDYWMQHEDDEKDHCVFCQRDGDDCICDATYDFHKEQEIMDD